MAMTTLLAQPAYAHRVVAPAVPYSLRVPDGNVVFLEGHGDGTQNYVCSPSGAGFAWVLFTPEATLSSDADKQVTTHFFSPNPDRHDPNVDARIVANGAIRATWQHSRDGSKVWAKVAADPSFDEHFVAPNSVPWLLLASAGTQDGPTGGDTLTPTTFVQRVNTHGGLAPASGCSQAADDGKKAFVHYTADYFFFRSIAADDE
jgi:hypothetical protein